MYIITLNTRLYTTFTPAFLSTAMRFWRTDLAYSNQRKLSQTVTQYKRDLRKRDVATRLYCNFRVKALGQPVFEISELMRDRYLHLISFLSSNKIGSNPITRGWSLLILDDIKVTSNSIIDFLHNFKKIWGLSFSLPLLPRKAKSILRAIHSKNWTSFKDLERNSHFECTISLCSTDTVLNWWKPIVEITKTLFKISR